jgi:hypothetical protein
VNFARFEGELRIGAVSCQSGAILCSSGAGKTAASKIDLDRHGIAASIFGPQVDNVAIMCEYVHFHVLAVLYKKPPIPRTVVLPS